MFEAYENDTQDDMVLLSTRQKCNASTFDK